MEKLKSLQNIYRHNIVFLITALLVIIADQLSKLWIISNLVLGESIPEKGFFRLTYVQNTGSSFGLFQNQNLALSIVAITGASIMLFLVFFLSHRFDFLNTILGRVSLGLIFSGTVGNLINRLIFGYVIDFIDFSFWPTFNIADSSAVVGAFLLAYSLIRSARQSGNSDG